MQNYLIKSLAIVGTISLIIMACSADEANNSNETNSTANTNVVGKYQISSSGGGNGFHVINTETGVVKTYFASASSTNTSGTYFVFATTTANP